MRNFVGFIGACIIFVAVCVFGFKLIQQNSGVSDDSQSASTSDTSTAVEQQPVYTVNEAGLTAVQAALTSSALDTSVSITDLQTGKTYHYGDTASYTAASVGKLITAVTYLHSVDTGNASLDDVIGGSTARSQLQKMIVNSDNTAWHYMETAVTLSAQQMYAEKLGLINYGAAANTVTSDDIALLLAKLSGGKILSSDNADLLLSYMQQANYRGYIVAAIPADVAVYHKVGLLDDRLLDAAIIKKGDRSYVLVIFSKSLGTYPFSQGTTLFGSVTKATLQAFFSEN